MAEPGGHDPLPRSRVRARGMRIVGAIVTGSVFTLFAAIAITAATESNRPADRSLPVSTATPKGAASATTDTFASPEITSAQSPTPTPPASLKLRATPTPVKKTDSHVGKGAAIAALASLAVKGRAPKTGYDRRQFGQRWRDLDRNGCDQRNDILRRDLEDLIIKTGTHGCLVLAGTLNSPDSGKIVKFTRGQTTSSAVQIDHTVALGDAWQKGAQQLSEERREQFANDFLNLRAIDGSTNASKSDRDAASWLPPRKKYWCGFVARQIAVKKKYDLWLTSAERDTMARVLNVCPDQGLPRAYPVKLGGGVEKDEVRSPAKNTKPVPLAGRGSQHFKNCTAARDAGAAPVRKGKPGYGRHLDRDGDGIGCE